MKNRSLEIDVVFPSVSTRPRLRRKPTAEGFVRGSRSNNIQCRGRRFTADNGNQLTDQTIHNILARTRVAMRTPRALNEARGT